MTEKEYMEQLTARLTIYPAVFQKEIREVFAEHFSEGRKEGKSDQEIIDSLGSVEDVMDNIRMMYTPEESEKTSADLHSSMESLSSSLHNVIVSVSAAVSGSLNSAARNISEQKEAVERNETKGFITDSVNRISIRSNGGSVNIHVREGRRLEYHFTPVFSLFAEETAALVQNTGYETAVFEISSGNADLHISVPDSVSEIEYLQSDGSFKISSLQLDSLYGKSSGGDFEADGIRCRSVFIESFSGSFDADESRMDDCRFSSCSGDIDLNQCHGNLDLKTTSGDIDISEHAGGEIHAVTVSGDIDLETDTRIVSLNTVSGDIDVHLSGEIEKADLSAVTGDIYCRMDDRRYRASVYTKSGDITNRTGLSWQKTLDEAYVIGEGLAEVNIETKSGDISLK